MGGGGEGGSDGARKELIETVLTCEGNIKDPELPLKISRLIHHLQIITDCKSSDWLVRKVEPWNSVRVTFSIPKEAAGRLHQLAQSDASALRQLGILSVQVEGDRIVSLRVAGPNNETAEILIRTDSLAGPSGERCRPSVPNLSPHVSGIGGGLLPAVLNQHHPQPHPVPRFRSPSNPQATDGFPASQGRLVSQLRTHEFPVGEPLPSSPQQAQHVHHGSMVSHHPSTIQRPVYPVNPPPPYPSNDLRVPAKATNPQQRINISSLPAQQQQFVTQSNVSLSSNQQSSLGTPVQTLTSGFRSHNGQMNTVESTNNLSNRSQIKVQGSTVKNSPLLVGLLQQPEQNSPASAQKSKKYAVVSTTQTVANYSTSVLLENGPVSNGNIVASSSLVPSVLRSQDSSLIHQKVSSACSSAGSLIANNHLTSISTEPNSSSNAISTLSSDRLNDSRKLLPIASTSVQCSPALAPSTVVVNKDTQNVDDTKDSTSTVNKKESQYLINPNTGLLEPRPNTDSSDSEPDFRSDSPDNFHSAMSMNEDCNISQKGLNSSDASVKQGTTSSLPEPKNAQDRAWESDTLSSSPGEKIKLRLKLGKEQMAQTTLVSPVKKHDHWKEIPTTNAADSSPVHSGGEPKVPKLHIKLHYSQPVIIKSTEDQEDSLDSCSKEERIYKKKISKFKGKNSEVSLEPFKLKSVKDKLNLDHPFDEEDPSLLDAKALMDLKSKSEIDVEDKSWKYKDMPGGRNKVSRMSDFMKPKVESKLRTRLKKPGSLRKVGDLSSVGEIASHKIMETLPPSITKVAAIHTQQPHKNPSSISPVPFSPGTPSSLNASVPTSSSYNSPSVVSPPFHLVAAPSSVESKPDNTIDKRASENKTEKRVDCESSTSDILMTTFRMNSSPIKGLLNGDVPHGEKVKINQMRFKRTGLMSPQTEFPCATKLTIKRKNVEETHTLKSLKKDGLTSVPTFLNSSVLINKVSSDSPNVSGGPTSSANHGQEVSDKVLRKVDNIKSSIRSEISSLKSNSDITIHSVSKNDIFGLSKLNELEKKSDLIVKAKPEPSTKVGKVTCVDVMDRKALEEALKSSRNSSKKNETAVSRSTSSMVDRLRRWNSIDNSSTVPLSSHSLSQPSESTNSSVLIKEELKERGENSSISEANLSMSASSTSGSVKNDPTVSKHSSKDNVHTNSCDNSDKERVDVAGSRLSCTTEREQNQIENNCETVPPDCDQKKPVASAIEIPDLQSERRALALNEVDIVDVAMKSKCEQVKITEIGSSLSSLKSEIESPEGTPKGEHGNGHGGEDSGIESMDTLSEKSPNHSDQSPNRREEKECDLYADKCKLSKTIVPPAKVKNEAKENFETASSVVSCNTLVKDQNCTENDLPESCPSKSKDSEATVLKNPLESSKDASNVLKVLKNETEADNIATKNQDHQYASIKECTNNDGNSYHTVVSTSAEKVDVFTSNEVRESNFSHMQDSLSSVTSKVSSSSHSVNSPIYHSINSVTTTSQIVTSVLSSPTTTSTIVFTSNSNIKIVNCHCSSTTITSSLSVSSPKTSVVTSSCLGTSPVISNCPNQTLPSLHPIKTHDCSSVPPVPVTLSVNLKYPSVAKSIGNDKLTSEAFSDTVDKISDKKSETVVSFSSSFPSAHCNVSSYSCRSALDSSHSSPSMIVLTTTTSVNTIMTSSNNTKVVSLKPSRSQAPKPSINPPLGKAFRLVAVHGISPMVPSTSPVKGQLVTVKPVISTCSSQSASKTSSLLQTVPSAKVEDPVQHSILKARLTSEHSSAVDQTSASSKSCETISSSSESHVDDLDFVGFSSPEKLAAESKEATSKGSKETENSDPDCLANKEDPTPLRLNPPLYTYGNKEKKKEADSDNEEREKEEMSGCKVVLSETLPLSLLSPAATATIPDQKPPDCAPVVIKTEATDTEQSSSDVHSDTKDRKLNELTIEIPNSEILPDDKRLTRSTRHSARLASPKINSPAGSEVSPMPEKRSITSISSLSRPSPVGITRSSVSPALKGVKRGRHESESSTTSNLSEDLTESCVKAPRRKIADRVTCKEEDGPKSKLFKKDVESMDKEKEAESSEGEISLDGESTLSMKRRAVSDVPMENTEEASRPSSRSGRCSTRTRDRQQLSSVNVASSSDSSSPVPRATTPTRRTLRQSKAARVASPSPSPSPAVAVSQAPTASPGVGSALEKTEVVAPEAPAAPEKKGAALEGEKTGRSAQRVLRKDATEGDADAAASGRRKTRSATNVVTNTDECRRRRHSKEK